MQKTRTHAWIKWLLAILVFLSIWCFLFWKCRYGFGNIDESFYLTIPYRLCQGDGLLLEEWHLSQTSGLLLMPAMHLHNLFFGSTDGIILHFRYLYTAVWGVAAAFFFYRLKPYSFAGAFAAALVFMIYAPFGIMALSYNSMGILLLLNAIIIASTAKKHLRIQYALTGVFFAGAVLCCPYLAAVYVLCAVTAVILLLIFKGEKRRAIGNLLLWTTVGCALLAAVFAVFVLSRASLSDIIKAFPTMMQDPEHPKTTLYQKILIYKDAIHGSSPHIVWILSGTALLSLLGCLLKKLRGIFLMLSSGIALLYLYQFVFVNRYLNFVMLPLTLVGIYCGISTKNKQIRILFIGVITGLLYTFCIHMASNQAFYCIASAAAVSSVISAAILPMYLAEIMQKRNSNATAICGILPAAAVCILLCCQLSAETYIRYHSIFWESDSIADENTLLEEGPEKGILVNAARAAEYHRKYETIRPIFEGTYGENVLFLSETTWYYLCGSTRSCAYSSWLSGVSEQNIKRQLTYYELSPEKRPDVIFFEEYQPDFAALFTAQGYNEATMENGSVILRNAMT